ncbi:MAG: TRAM domain-containing protein, partial [Cyanobacteria bacterium J06648_11]
LRVLNVNEVAEALRPTFIPGDTLSLKLVKEGKEAGQGVGYLDDGTMVVVEDGQPQVGKKVAAMVTSSLQTPAGRMIFARLDKPVPVKA